MTLKLGMMTGYWGAQPPADLIGTAQQAEKLGWACIGGSVLLTLFTLAVI